jgi:hypothetical protein
MQMQQQRQKKHHKVVQGVVGVQADAFDNADYESGAEFLRDWRRFQKRLAPHTPDIVGALDQCVRRLVAAQPILPALLLLLTRSDAPTGVWTLVRKYAHTASTPMLTLLHSLILLV